MKSGEGRVWRWSKERLRERATVRLTEAEKDSLDEQAIRTGRTVSDLLREAAAGAGLIGQRQYEADKRNASAASATTHAIRCGDL